MVQQVVFINLFFIPVLLLYLIKKKSRKPLTPNLEMLPQYCIAVICNILLTKTLLFPVKKFRGAFISMDSGYYTLAALASAVLIYKVLMYFSTQSTYYRFYLKKTYLEKLTGKSVKQIVGELAPAYLLVFVSCFMLLVHEPILMYASNRDDFWFDFKIMIGPTLGVFACFLLVGILLMSALYFANLLVSGRLILFRAFCLLGYLTFFLLYLQGNWLAGNLPVLTGEPIVWENYGKSENFILAIATVILIVGMIWSVRKNALRKTIYRVAAVAAAVCIMLSVSLVSIIADDKTLESKDSFVPTLENFNKISSNRNFLIFLVDSMDSKRFYEVMCQDEDFRDLFEDFTYYPDTLSHYSYTTDAIPLILSGVANHREFNNYKDYSINAYNQSRLFEKLEKNKYEINLYSTVIGWNGGWGGDRIFEIANATSIYDVKVKFRKFMGEELKYILFKYLPYSMKQTSQIETLDFNSCKIEEPGIKYYTWENMNNYAYMRENPTLNQDIGNYFQFVHCEGSHIPYDMDKNLNSTGEKGTYEQKIAASLTLIKTYLQRLKGNGFYDNSAIVIMADHGVGTAGYELPYGILDRENPILLIKGIKEKHQMLKSDKPVSYMDLQDAFCDLIDGKQSTELFAKLKNGRMRTAISWSGFDDDPMVEYETTGPAWDVMSFVPTGNVYDIEE